MDEHLEHMRLVLQRFKEEGLKLRLKKRFFGLYEMNNLGYTVWAGKISISTRKVEAVSELPVRATQKEVRSFVQFYILRHIHPSLQRPYGSIDEVNEEVPTTKAYTDACMFGSL
jgi:hypothetical protein